MQQSLKNYADESYYIQHWRNIQIEIHRVLKMTLIFLSMGLWMFVSRLRLLASLIR